MNFINQFFKLLLRAVITAQQQQRLLELEESFDINYSGYDQDFDEDKIEEILAEYNYDTDDVLNGNIDDMELEEIFEDYFQKIRFYLLLRGVKIHQMLKTYWKNMIMISTN